MIYPFLSKLSTKILGSNSIHRKLPQLVVSGMVDIDINSFIILLFQAGVQRGMSTVEFSVFGADIVIQFLNQHKFDLVCRAHQVVEDGYEFFAKRKLVTLFSAPNYSDEFDNAGGMMVVDETLVCSFIIIKPLNVERIDHQSD